MSRFAQVDGAGNVASISSDGSLKISGTVLAGLGVQVSSSALETAYKGVNVSSSAQEVLDQTWRSSFTSSVSTQSIKVGAGVLYGYLGTTAGTINFSLDGKPIGATTVSAGVIVTLPCPIHFAASLSASASSAVCTVFYK
jgi:hypothetical protein